MRPPALLIRRIEVQQEKRHAIRRARFHDRLLAPCLENSSGGVGFGGVVGRGVGEGGEGGDGCYFVVEVVREGGLEGRHYREEFGAREGGWGCEVDEVGFEGCEACEEGFWCVFVSWEISAREEADGTLVAGKEREREREINLLCSACVSSHTPFVPRTSSTLGNNSASSSS
jgi:hypothetical protein